MGKSTITVEDILPKGVEEAVQQLDRTFEHLEFTIEEIQKATVRYNKAQKESSKDNIESIKKVQRAFGKVNRLGQERLALQKKLKVQQQEISFMQSQLVKQESKLSRAETRRFNNKKRNIQLAKIKADEAYRVEVRHHANLERLDKSGHTKRMRQMREESAALSVQRKQQIIDKGGSSSTVSSGHGGLAKMLGKGGAIGLGIAATVKSVQLLYRGLKDVAELAAKYDALNFKMSAVLDNNAELSNSMGFLNGLTKKYGGNLLATSEQYVKFVAAAKESHLSMAEGKKIFESVTKAGTVLGLSNTELTSTYVALEQMLSKGKVSAEELRRQLGNSLPAAVELMAKSMNVGTGELEKMLKMGEVLSSEVLPMFAQELDRAYGDKAGDKLETMRSQLDRVGSSMDRLLMTVLDSKQPFIQLINTIVEGFGNAIGKFTEMVEDVDQARARIAGESGESLRAKEQENLEKAQEKAVDKLERGWNAATKKFTETASSWVTRQSEARQAVQEEFNAKFIKAEKDKQTQIEELEKEVWARKLKFARDREEDNLRLAMRTMDVDEGKDVEAAVFSASKTQKLNEQERDNAKFYKDSADELAKLNSEMQTYKSLQKDADKQVKGSESRQSKGRLVNFTAKEIANARKKEILDLEIMKKIYEEIYTDADNNEKTRLLGINKAIEAERELILTKSLVAREKEGAGSRTKVAGMQEKVDNIDIQNTALKGSSAEGDAEKLAKNKATKIEIIKAIEAEEKRSATEVSFLLFKLQNDLQDVAIKNIDIVESIKIDEATQAFKFSQIYADLSLERAIEDIEEKYENTVGGEDTAQREIAKIQNQYRAIKLQDEIDFINEVTALKIKSEAKIENKKLLDKGVISQDEFDSRDSSIDSVSAEDMFDGENDDFLAKMGLSPDQITEATQKLLELGIKLKGVNEEGERIGGNKLEDFLNSDEMQAGIELMNEAFNSFSSFQQMKIDSLNEEKSLMEERYDREIELAEGNEKLQKDIANKKRLDQKKYDERIKREKNKQAKLDKAAAIANIILGTAVSVSGAKTIGLKILHGVMGGIQLATAIATPLPKYKDGTKNHVGGKALVGDGGKKEIIINPDGTMSLTRDTAHVVEMKAGSQVMPDANEYIKNVVLSSMTKSYSSKENSSSNFNQAQMENAITNAFSRAKVTNHNHLPKIDVNYALWKGSQIDF